MSTRQGPASRSTNFSGPSLELLKAAFKRSRVAASLGVAKRMVGELVIMVVFKGTVTSFLQLRTNARCQTRLLHDLHTITPPA